MPKKKIKETPYVKEKSIIIFIFFTTSTGSLCNFGMTLLIKPSMIKLEMCPNLTLFA